MANLPSMAGPGVPVFADTMYGRASAGNTAINVGDFLIASGLTVLPTALAAAGARAGRASAIGIALEPSTLYDSFGNAKANTALLFARTCVIRVSAYDNVLASGEYPLACPVYPATTGSAVNSPTGKTGVAAQWATAPHVTISANPTGAGALGIGVIVGMAKLGSGSGNTQIDVLVLPPTPSYL